MISILSNWNKLPNEIKTAFNVPIFKYKFKKYIANKGRPVVENQLHHNSVVEIISLADCLSDYRIDYNYINVFIGCLICGWLD